MQPSARHVAILAERPRPDLAALLAERGYRVSEIGTEAELPARLAASRPDAVFNATAGTLGRSGRLQGVLEVLGIPFTHSGVLASALAVDRHQAKVMFRAAGLPVTDHLIVDRAEAARSHQLPPPYVVKPLLAGSGEAAILVPNDRELPPRHLLSENWRGGEEVMVERFVPGRTLAVAVMGGVAHGVSEVVVAGEPEAGAAKKQLVTPAQISPNIYEKLQKMSLKAHEVLGCRGVTRMRFRCHDLASGDSGLVCLDIDTQPDLTPASVLPEQARNAGHSLAELVAWMVEDASCNR